MRELSNKTRPVVKEYIYESLMILMRNSEFDKIKISDIANKAGVSRMTYYRNYVSKEHIIETHIDYIFDQIAQTFSEVEEKSVEKFFEVFFDYMKEERVLFVNVQCTNLIFGIYDIFLRNCLSIFANNFAEFENSDKFNNYLVATIGACISLLYEWSKNKDSDIKEYSFVINDLVNALKNKIL